MMNIPLLQSVHVTHQHALILLSLSHTFLTQNPEALPHHQPEMKKLRNRGLEKWRSVWFAALMSILIRLQSRKWLITARAGDRNLRQIGAERHVLTNPYCRQSKVMYWSQEHTHMHLVWYGRSVIGK